MHDDNEFSPMPYRRRAMPRGDTNVYRIVKPDGESVVSEGRTAAEAFQKSGVSRAIRIVRESYENKVILGKDEFPGEEKSAAPKQAPQEAPPAAQATPAVKPEQVRAPEKELSEDDIKKLLDDGKGA